MFKSSKHELLLKQPKEQQPLPFWLVLCKGHLILPFVFIPLQMTICNTL